MRTFRESIVWFALGICFIVMCPKDAEYLRWLKGEEVASLVGNTLQCRRLKDGEMNPIFSTAKAPFRVRYRCNRYLISATAATLTSETEGGDKRLRSGLIS